MSAKNGLPRLGSKEAAAEAALETKMVSIPDRGVTVVLRKPSVGAMLDLQSSHDVESEDVDVQFGFSVALVASMLAEPEMDADALRKEVREWSFDDWRLLQSTALEFAGLGEESQRNAQASFPGAGT